MAEKKISHELRWAFLREYTKHLIMNSISDEERNLLQERKEESYLPEPEHMIKGMIKTPGRQVIPLARREYPKISPLPGQLDLGKLNLFLADPRVNQLECYGPEKDVLVRVGNQTQKTRVNLSKEEIESIIKDFSEKTRIPVIRGVFRAALGNLILTAVTSDFVDTRFTIQKKAPFQKP